MMAIIEFLRSVLSKLREIPLVGWLLAIAVGAGLYAFHLFLRLQMQRDNARVMGEIGRARRKLKQIEIAADDTANEEKQKAEEIHERRERELAEVQEQILALESTTLADEINRFFSKPKAKSKVIRVEDLSP